MAKVIVVNNVSLDGVMQAPARPDEDTRGGFTRGGWAIPYGDSVMLKKMGEGMAQEGALLFGRRTYEDFFSVWPNRTNNPFTDHLNNVQKYVASNTLGEPLPWSNSNLLIGDAPVAVANLKSKLRGNLTILGSGELIHSLVRRNLIDEFLLLIHPLVLGSGLRLFPEDASVALRLVESITTTKGVIIATYQASQA